MMDLFDDVPADNTPEFSVAEISGAVKKAIEGGFSHVRVRGEVGRVSRPASGHIYMDLKDDRAVLAGVIWKGRAQGLAHRPEEGMEVIATGKLTTFPGQSKYQMVIEDIAPAGAGALMAMLEKRKAALAAEGLFAPERKRPLPYLPEIIGVITSPSGAVIRDILHRLRDRFPRKVLVWPVAVQGQKCAPEVAAAIAGFNAMTPGGALPRPDLLIVARGGGSLEDLWGFNEEIVARAAAASDIPLISAVGHETDTTLIDYVSDMRAPTPTAAAELAVPVRMELLAWTDQQGARLSRALSTSISQRQQRVRDLGRALPQVDALVEGPRQRLDYLSERLPAALRGAAAKKRLQISEAALRPAILSRRVAEDRRRLEAVSARLMPALQRRSGDARRMLDQSARGLRPEVLQTRVVRQGEQLGGLLRRLSDRASRQQAERTARLQALDRLRETLGYVETLRRGYAVVRGDGAVVTGQAAAAKATALEIEFADGKLAVRKTL
ncbi:MAG: exodeoxyribonuclease VII large subunit [Yoonia sp.]|uniref:exodeoxyribonuclease VII large subunit n=1 Tax=Yoonia sp. TaxID=2212373 RepID=UPI003EFA39C5